MARPTPPQDDPGADAVAALASGESPVRPRKGRGALTNPAGRFETRAVEAVDDGWGSLDEPLPALETIVLPEPAKSVLSRNDSPDLPFETSLNPYRGCEHGCIYCYARPSHAYVGLSSGLDFETRLFYKQDAVARLATEVARPGYRCTPINLGANTDPYQPIEHRYRVTRSLLEALLEWRHPVTIITKGAMIVRDVDVLSALAAERLVRVLVSVTTLDDGLKRIMEPRAAGPAARLKAIERLSAAGVPVAVMAAPIIPAINDDELERLLEAAANAGADRAGYTLLRLSHDLEPLFATWLDAHFPDRAQRVWSRIESLRGGRHNDTRFHVRMRGVGPYAELLKSRFHAACRKHGLGTGRGEPLATDRFVPPRPVTPQMSLW